MALLVLGLVLFLGIHSTRVFADGWRTATIGKMGEKAWKGVYSLLSIAAFVVLVWGYMRARQDPVLLWTPPVAMRHVAALLMVIAFVLFVAAYVPRNWFKARLHHPQFLSVKVWAFAHLLANGDLGSIILFTSLLAWAVVARISTKRRDEVLDHGGPIAAPAGWRNDILALVIGTVIYLAFLYWLHPVLIGVPAVPR